VQVDGSGQTEGIVTTFLLELGKADQRTATRSATARPEGVHAALKVAERLLGRAL
jgi:hypothetical protein